MDFNPSHNTRTIRSQHIDEGGLGQRIMNISLVQRVQDIFLCIREDEQSDLVLSQVNALRNEFHRLLMNTKFGKTGPLDTNNRDIVRVCGEVMIEIKKICPWYNMEES